MTAQTAETETDAPGSNDYEPPEWLSLDDDEEIEWMGEPVPVSIVGTAIWGVILTIFLIGILILLLLPVSWLSIKNTDYVVTNKALYVKKGIASTNIESVGLDKIQNTEYSQSFWGKQFEFGSIEISTAGSSGAQVTFQNISEARDVRELITSLSNEYTSGRTGTTGEESESADRGPADADGMAELVEELRATRQAMESVERRLAENGRGGAGENAGRRDVADDRGRDRDDPTTGDAPQGTGEDPTTGDAPQGTGEDPATGDAPQDGDDEPAAGFEFGDGEESAGDDPPDGS